MKTILALSALALCAVSVVRADPAVTVLSQDSTGVTVTAADARHYGALCTQYPTFGDHSSDGVVVFAADQFHLDNQHYADFQKMLAAERNARNLAESKVADSQATVALGR